MCLVFFALKRQIQIVSVDIHAAARLPRRVRAARLPHNIQRFPQGNSITPKKCQQNQGREKGTQWTSHRWCHVLTFPRFSGVVRPSTQRMSEERTLERFVEVKHATCQTASNSQGVRAESSFVKSSRFGRNKASLERGSRVSKSSPYNNNVIISPYDLLKAQTRQ